MYEIVKFMVRKFTKHYIVYSKLLLFTSVQVHSSLQQIIASYKSMTNQWVLTLFQYWQFVFQPIKELQHFFTVAQPSYLGYFV